MGTELAVILCKKKIASGFRLSLSDWKGKLTMQIQLDTLKRLFRDSLENSCLSINSQCHSCGCEFTIEIHHLSSGYGLLGGVLFESESNSLIARCDACCQSKSDPPYTANYKSKNDYLRTN